LEENEMTSATATPPTSISVIEEEQSYTPPGAPPMAPAGMSLLPLGTALQTLVELEEGWDSYGALAPTRAALTSAWMTASSLGDLGHLPQVFPTRRGGVQLEWHTPHTTLEWEIDPSGGTGVFIFDNHATDEKFDGELPADMYRLGLALAQVYTDR
jgi:hypothetical protein